MVIPSPCSLWEGLKLVRIRHMAAARIMALYQAMAVNSEL